MGIYLMGLVIAVSLYDTAQMREQESAWSYLEGLGQLQ
jgi:hypothetical protein